MKICTKCSLEKPYSEFQKAKGYKDGHQTWCKQCKYENSRKWVKGDPERQKRATQASAKWYQDGGKEWHANWRDENRNKVREANRRYAATHLEERREMYRKRRRQIRGTVTDITIEWLRELQSITPNCELCECELLYNATQHDHRKANLDHIIPLGVDGTHSRDNVRYICYLCNLRRPRDGSDHLLSLESPELIDDMSNILEK
jgi:hypothetical protein